MNRQHTYRRYKRELDLATHMATYHPNTLLDHETDHGIWASDDEPLFVLRASDIVAPDTVRAWAGMAERAGADTRLVARARALAAEMEGWARDHNHRVIEPDDDITRPGGSVAPFHPPCTEPEESHR